MKVKGCYYCETGVCALHEQPAHGCPKCDDLRGVCERLVEVLKRVEFFPCGHHEHGEMEDGGAIYFCPWCEADKLLYGNDQGLPEHKSDCPRQQALASADAVLWDGSSAATHERAGE